MKLTQLLIGTMMLTLMTTSAFAAKVTFTWTANSETNLAGYKLYYGGAPGVYDGDLGDLGPSPVDIPLAALEDAQDPEFSLTGMPSCIHLHFVLTAYNTEGAESDYSDAVDATMVTKPSLVDFGVKSGEQSITMEWLTPQELDANDDGQIVGYRVHYSGAPGEPYDGDFADQGDSPLDIDPDQTRFSLTGLPSGTSVYVTVEAVCEDGTTGRSEEKVSAIIDSDSGYDNAGALGGGCTLAPASNQTSGDLFGMLIVGLLLGILRIRRRVQAL